MGFLFPLLSLTSAVRLRDTGRNCQLFSSVNERMKARNKNNNKHERNLSQHQNVDSEILIDEETEQIEK